MSVGSGSVLFIFLFVFISASAGVQDVKTLDIVDGLLASLSYDEWSQKELPCLQTTTALLKGVKNQTLWATWVWNSMQMPLGTFYGSKYHLGNFDQCLQVPWSSHDELQMQYCLVDVKLADLRKHDGKMEDPYANADGFISKESFYGKRFNTLSIGVCLPSVCEPASIAKISRHLYQMSYLPFEDFNVNPLDCQTVGQRVERSLMFYLYWCLLMVLSSIVLLTYYMGNKNTDTTMSKALYCFSLTRNYNTLIETSENDMTMMHGIRGISSCVLIVLHYPIFANVAVINFMDVEKAIEHGYGAIFLHLDSMIETYFVMSGLLHMKGLLSSKSSKPFKTLCKRYLRLIATFSLAIATFAFVYPHLGSGPLWPRMMRKVQEPCTRNWWRNHLMLGHRDDQSNEFCIMVSWYIICDYQLTVFGTIIFLVYRNNKIKGLIFFVLSYILSVLIPGAITYWNKLPGIMLFDLGEAQILEQNRVLDAIHIKSYARAASYLLGLAMGFMMTIYRPQDYRKTVSKAASITGFVFGSSLVLVVLHLGYNVVHKEYGEVGSSIIAAVDKSIWSLGICIIIIVCEYGTLPIINDLLRSRLFVPLSKMSYVNYMIHTVFIFRNVSSIRTPLRYDFFESITHGFGYILMSSVFSFLLWFIFEAPVLNLINILFKDSESPKSKTTGETSNAVHQNEEKTEKMS